MLFRPQGFRTTNVAALYGTVSTINPAIFSEYVDIADLSTLYVERTGSPPSTLASVNGVVGSVFNKGTAGGYYRSTTADSRRPILRQSGSFYYLEFDGTDDNLQRAFTQSQPFSRVSCIRAVTSTANRQIFGGATANAGVLYRDTTTTLGLFSGTVLGGPTVSNSADVVMTERHNGASSRIAVDNGSYTTGNAGTTVSGGITIGDSNSTGSPASMRLYAMVADNSDISDANIAQLRTILGAKAGLTL